MDDQTINTDDQSTPVSDDAGSAPAMGGDDSAPVANEGIVGSGDANVGGEPTTGETPASETPAEEPTSTDEQPAA